MDCKKFLYLFIFFILFSVGCNEEKNFKEYFPGPNGEKPADFVYTFLKDYKLDKTDTLKFLESLRLFAKKHSMYKGKQASISGGSIIEYYVAGPPMKFLLQIIKLDDSHYRVQISNHPGRACFLCNAFIKEVDSKLSGVHE